MADRKAKRMKTQDHMGLDIAKRYSSNLGEPQKGLAEFQGE